MENDTTTPTPVQQSNQSAALPGSGGASAAYGGASASLPAATAESASSTPYAAQTTPVNTSGVWPVNVRGEAPGPRMPTEARTKDDTIASDAGTEAAPPARAEPLYVAPVTGIIARGPGNVFTADRGGGRRNHSGVDMTAPNGTSVAAAIGGTVRYVGNNSGYGMNAVIVGDDGNVFRYATHGTVTVKSGDRVERGQEIGTIGAGHLHFEAIKSDSPLYGRLSTSNEFVPTSWMRGTPNPGVTDPLEIFGIGGGLRVSAGQALGEMRGLAQELTINPRLRDAVVTAPAFGAKGARSVPDPLSTMAIAAAVGGGQLLRRGSSGSAVEELQGFLNARGITDANGQTLAVDGVFGRATRAAVKRYQGLSAIEVDGIAGPETLRAVLYDIDPSLGPASDGEVAYKNGAAAAAAIVAPADAEQIRREVAMPSPRPRPERGAGIPNPRLRPGSATADLSAEEIDRLTAVDENGNYINQPPAEGNPPPAKAPYQPTASPMRQDASGNFYYGPADVGRSVSEYRSYLMMSGIEGDSLDRMVTRLEQGLMRRGNFRYASGRTAAEIGAMTSDYRDALIQKGETGDRLNERVTTYERTLKRIIGDAQRTSDATDAARGATRQRLSGMVPRTDRFRPRDSRAGGEVERIRTTEAVREYARGIADVYRRVADRGRTMPAVRVNPADQRFVTDALMRAVPTPAETVTETYAFRRPRVV